MVNAGIKGFKCFLIHSGVDEFPCVAENDVRLAMKQMQGTDAVFLVCGLASNKAGIWQGVWEMMGARKQFAINEIKLFNVGSDSLVVNLPIIGL